MSKIIDLAIITGAGIVLYEIIKCKANGKTLGKCIVEDVVSETGNLVKEGVKEVGQEAYGASKEIQNESDQQLCKSGYGNLPSFPLSPFSYAYDLWTGENKINETACDRANKNKTNNSSNKSK
jgi:hypothetical protein